MEAEVIQHFKGKINGVIINEEGTFYATRTVLESIEERFGECYNQKFVKTLSDTIYDVSSSYDEYSQSVLEYEFMNSVEKAKSFPEIKFNYLGNDWKIETLNKELGKMLKESPNENQTTKFVR
jgi:cell wall-associated serine proteinase prtA